MFGLFYCLIVTKYSSICVQLFNCSIIQYSEQNFTCIYNQALQNALVPIFLLEEYVVVWPNNKGHEDYTNIQDKTKQAPEEIPPGN